jgi:CheY-like chemotaxis protein
MLKWGTYSLVAALTLSFLPMAVAQDPGSTLKEAIALYESGKNDAALEKLRAVIAADPSSEQAWSLRNAVEQDMWARIMIKGDAHHAVVAQLFRLAIPAEKAQTASDEAIKALVEKLDSPDWSERQAASIRLAADHGEYAAAYLARRLGSEDTELRAGTMEWLRRMGRRAVMPLIQMLDSENPLVVANCITLLGQAGDVRALPYLAAFGSMPADRVGAMISNAAKDACKRMGCNASSEADIGALFFGTAEAYYQRNGDFVADGTTVWSFEGGKLVAREVPAALYHLKLAEDILYDMYNYDATCAETATLLASVLVAQADAVAGMSSDDAAKVAAAADASTLAKALGAAALDGVVKKALADNRGAVGAAAIRLLSGMSSDCTGCSIADALKGNNRQMRFAAALAIGSMGHGADLDGALVETLAEMLGQDALRTAVVIDDNEATRSTLVAGLNKAGWFATGVASGGQGLSTVRQLPLEDVVIVRYDLKDRTSAEIVRTLAADARTASIPVVMLADENTATAAQEQFGSKAKLMLTTPLAEGSFEPQVRALLSSLDGAREAATAEAARAAAILAHMCGGITAGASKALQATLKGEDRVRVPAMRALGNIGDASSIAGLLAVFGDASASEEARCAAIVAAARVANAGGKPNADVNAALTTALGTATGALRGSVGTAAGIAPADAETRKGWLNALRGGIAVNLGG